MRQSAEEARRLGGEFLPLDAAPNGLGRIAFTVREPMGVVVAVTPSNDPLNLASHKLGPALAAGNTVVLKPSSDTPVSALELAMTYGPKLDEKSQMGPMVNVGEAKRIEQWINEAKEAGARLLAGGAREGNVVDPTVFADVPVGLHAGVFSADYPTAYHIAREGIRYAIDSMTEWKVIITST